MTEELAQLGNPSSLHNAGRRARRVVEESREQIAEAYGARPSEVVFTSGGTEADNLAIKGLFWARRAAARRGAGCWPPPPSTTPCSTACGWLAEHEGAEADWLPRGPARRGQRGRPWPRPSSADPATRGPDQRHVGEQRGRHRSSRSPSWPQLAAEHQIPFHSDAVQAAGQLPVSLAGTGATALTITAHKIGGPVGDRRAAAGQGRRAGAGAARRRPGARRPLRHAGRPGHPGVRRRRPGRPPSAAATRPSGWPRCATT